MNSQLKTLKSLLQKPFKKQGDLPPEFSYSDPKTITLVFHYDANNHCRHCHARIDTWDQFCLECEQAGMGINLATAYQFAKEQKHADRLYT